MPCTVVYFTVGSLKAFHIAVFYICKPLISRIRANSAIAVQPI